MRKRHATYALVLCALGVARGSPGMFDTGNTAAPSASTNAAGGSASRLADMGPIRGINIGGVFLIEPFIRPSLFDQFNTSTVAELPVDEWTFSATLGKEEAKRQLEDHWDTFVTREHLEAMAEYGINWIRIPIGYWAFNLTAEEPFVDGQIPYVERLLGWAQEIGLKVELDLHGAPGSQNGYDNSGHRTSPQWLYTRINVDRTLDALRQMTELAIEWSDVVYGIQILNEPSRWKWPVSQILEFYNEAYDLMRSMTNDVYFMVHDTFLGPNDWGTLVSANWTDALMDTHIYQMFDNYIITLNETAHIDMVATMAENVTRFDKTSIGVVVGEFSAATHDCTRYINGFGRGSRWDGTLEGVDHPLCPLSNCSCTGDYGGNYTQFSSSYKGFLQRYVDAQLSIYDKELAGWFYWNFRTEGAPEWDYLLGVEQGWFPKFPRTAVPMIADKGESDEPDESVVDRVSRAPPAARGSCGTALALAVAALAAALTT